MVLIGKAVLKSAFGNWDISNIKIKNTVGSNKGEWLCFFDKNAQNANNYLQKSLKLQP